MGRILIRWLGWSRIVSVSFSYSFLLSFLVFYGLLADSALGQSWTAAWAFELVGSVFLLWMMIMAYQVYRDN